MNLKAVTRRPQLPGKLGCVCGAVGVVRFTRIERLAVFERREGFALRGPVQLFDGQCRPSCKYRIRRYGLCP
jgi:hypothetical protein